MSKLFLGYNFNTWGMASSAVRNIDKEPFTIRAVYFDGKELALGVVGVPTTHGNLFKELQNPFSHVDTLEMIFPQRNHYNLANYASASSTVPPDGFVFIYINVDAPLAGTEHELKVVTDKGTFSTTITPGETATFNQ